ncbi:MAG: BlaI/MecI/CopY family transcriptional regulator [Bacteroidales bacterium]|nr:BlaI/MecI/CopY family transcriptional regulator [Bacteroidales bacterium]
MTLMKLTVKEEEIMTIFWEHGEMFIRDILNYLPEPKPNYNTVATQVKFLEEKGFVTRKPVANTFLYVPSISEKEYSGSTISNVVRQYYNNSYASVVSQFVEDEKMDLEELKALIADIENRRK